MIEATTKVLQPSLRLMKSINVQNQVFFLLTILRLQFSRIGNAAVDGSLDL
jgi:hypothetical protein